MPTRRPAPAAAPAARLAPADYDAPAFLAELTAPAPDGRRRLVLALSDLRCYACVWLCESAARKLAPEATLQVSLDDGSAAFVFDPRATKVAPVIDLLARLGYPAVPLAPGTLPPARDDILRLGVALFCMLNVMSFTAADYLAGPGGLDAPLWHLFRALGLALATLAFFYAARPLLTGAWRAARARRVVIDQPLVLAMLSAYAYSAFDTVRGAGPVYFDSVVSVLALVLVGRYLQRRVYLRVERALGRAFDPAEDLAWIVTPAGPRLAPLRELRAGAAFLVPAGGMVPADAVVTSATGEVSREAMTGEPTPGAVARGDAVAAGFVNGASPLYCTATADALGCYARRARDVARRMLDEKGRLGVLCDRLAAVFFAVTLLVAAAGFAAGYALGPAAAVGRAVAVLLVACPCVFGFAAPLTFAVCAARGLERGVLFRSQRAVEQLAAARRFVFDKTGTLTVGTPGVCEARWDEIALAGSGLARGEILAFLADLRGVSSHHVVRAVSEWAARAAAGGGRTQPTSAVEVLGAGIVVTLASGHELRLGKRGHCLRGAADDGRSWLAVDGHLVASFGLADALRSDAQGMICWLRRQGVALSIASGDQDARTVAVAQALGFSPAEVEAERGPAAKAASLRRLGRLGGAVMVGNGVNDALALGAAAVGVAVEGASSAARAAADVCLTRPGLAPLGTAVALSRGATAALRRSFAFATVYNLLTMTLAATGHVTPLVAALLMPVNSLVVTAIATRWHEQGGGP